MIFFGGTDQDAQGAPQMRTVFPGVIRFLREEWAAEDLPFLFAQPPGVLSAKFQKELPDPVAGVILGGTSFAVLRESQQAALALPHTAMLVNADRGGGVDGQQLVSHRLAMAARALAYGEKVAFAGPLYDSMTVDGAKVRVAFKNAEGGLVAKDGALRGFQIAGEDKAFVWASARIEGETVVVSSPKIAKPAAVRYAFSDNPPLSLYNKDGLPASPFRTDDWPETAATR
jgi:sialate O-acetylesterase